MKDNSTGKDKEFYELGKKMFDRLNPPLVQREWVETNNQACKILRQVHDMLALASVPPRKTWVGLTGVEINHIFAANVGYPERMMNEVAKLLKEKNNG